MPDDIPDEFQKKPGRRGRISPVEFNRRIAFTANLLARRYLLPEIEIILRRQFNEKMSTRTVLRYMATARQLLRERYQGTDDPEAAGTTAQQLRDLHRKNSYTMYESIIRDPDSSNSDRLTAQAAIDRLLGLSAPLQIDTGTTDSDRLAELRQNALASAAARELLAIMAERMGGLADPLPDGSLPEHQPSQLEDKGVKTKEDSNRAPDGKNGSHPNSYTPGNGQS